MLSGSTKAELSGVSTGRCSTNCCTSGYAESQLNRGWSLSENGRGLPRTGVSTLSPKPDDEELSQSESQEALSSNLLMQPLLDRCMASATVYLVLPRAHISISVMLRSDWRNRCSRLSDNSNGVWTTLSKNSCRPLIRCKTWSVFLRLKKKVRGGSLGNNMIRAFCSRQWRSQTNSL